MSLQTHERARAFDILNQLIQCDTMNQLKEQVTMNENEFLCLPYIFFLQQCYCFFQNLIDYGEIMALCLMYLTDPDSTVEQATNTCLTKVLQLQTSLASGKLLNTENVVFFSMVYFWPGISSTLLSQTNGNTINQSSNGDAMQVS